MEREMGRDKQLMLPISDISDEDKQLAMIATPPVLSVSSGRKPRGRPPGSKNRPKPPVYITRESGSEMQHVVLEIASGADIVDAVSAFSGRQRLGVSILSGSGAVLNPAFHHTASAVGFNGRFEILSIAGTFLPPAPPAVVAALQVPVTVSLAGGHGQVIGGQVGGVLIASGPVLVVATTFKNADFHRLPPIPNEEEEEEEDDEEEVEEKVKEEDVGVGSSSTGNTLGGRNYNVGPSNMAAPMWGSRSPRAPPPHLLHPTPSFPPLPRF